MTYTPGLFVNADLDKASTENERNAVTVRMADGRRITFIQVAGLVARRIICYATIGQELARGERYGFIRFGSRVDVYLPADAEIVAQIGDKMTGFPPRSRVFDVHWGFGVCRHTRFHLCKIPASDD